MAFVDWMMGVELPDRLVPAVRVLTRMANPAMLPLFQHLLRSRSPAVRAETVRALAQLPFADVAALIEDKAGDPSEDVRLAVVEAAGVMPDAVTRLATLRRDPSVRVRSGVAVALERVQGPSARGAHRALEQMLGDTSSVVRAAALTSLAGSREPDGLIVFGRAWTRVALDTRVALRADPRAAAISDRIAVRLTSSSDPEERRSAVIAVGALAAKDFATWLIPALRDPSPAVRIAAVQGLAFVRDDGVRQAIGEVLGDPDRDVRDAAQRTLVRSVG
jgi:HEAT repeat protein